MPSLRKLSVAVRSLDRALKTRSSGGGLTASERKRLPAAAFGLPSLRKYPLGRPQSGGGWRPDAGHIAAARARAKQELGRGFLTKAQYAQIIRRATTAAGKA